MSEIPGNGDETTAAVETLVAKERWIQATTQYIIGTRILRVGRFNPGLALDGVRLASLWLDEFKALMATKSPVSKEGIKETMLAAKESATELSQTNHRYPGGVLSFQLRIAAYDAFCLAFEDEAAYASEVLGWDMEPYGIGGSEQPPESDFSDS